jgi:glycosyltransferase involved in cell wall biosynthesis
MPRVLVSVVMPYRDAAETVDEAIESILLQQAVELELVAVDDGSTDDGPARLADWARRDRRVRPVSSTGRGIVPALCAGIAHAKGELIARMDADDVALPTRLRLQVDRLAGDPRLAAVGCLVEAFPVDAVGEGLRRYVAWMNGLLTPEDHARDLFVEAPLCHPSVTVRRSALDAVGGFREVPWAEDYDLWLRLDEAGFSLCKIPEMLLRWRHRPGRATFRDPRYARARFTEAKSAFLARRLGRLARPLVMWGAGPTGKRLARALEVHGVRAARFVDIDPRKIGRVARGAEIVESTALEKGRQTVVVAVGARGARDLVRAELVSRGFVDGDDFLCAS